MANGRLAVTIDGYIVRPNAFAWAVLAVTTAAFVMMAVVGAAFIEYGPAQYPGNSTIGYVFSAVVLGLLVFIVVGLGLAAVFNIVKTLFTIERIDSDREPADG